MRRIEYQSNDPEEFRLIVETALVGHLGIITPDGFPRVVPVNFAARDNRVYFHGAVAGEKYEVLSTEPKVTFNAYLGYSIIPSYWIGIRHARGATMLYRSILIKGIATLVADVGEKCLALQLLMEKYQPEGNFVSVSPDAKAYDNILPKTAVFRIDPEQIDIKNNFPRNKSREFKKKLITNLRTRAIGNDLATAEELEKVL